MGKPIYLDYNATTPVDPEVIEEMLPYIRTHFGNPSSNNKLGRHNKEAIDKARFQVANLIGASPEEIIFTSGGTESNNHAIRGAVLANVQKGKHIITSAIEHPAVTEVCRYLEKQGYEITWVPVDSYGKINPVDVENAVRRDTVLITIMHANNEVGTIQPLAEIGKIAQKNNIVFHTDAAQSVGKIETSVKQLGVDLLSIAGHKIYAPKGIGALYIKRETKIEKLMYGANQENNVRPGTENLIHIVGLGKACEIALKDFNANSQNFYNTRQILLEGLLFNLENRVSVNTDLENSLPNTLSIAFEKVDAHTLTSLISNDVMISTGSACHSGITEISSVLQAMNIDLPAAVGTVRMSIGKSTTLEEIDHAVDAISKAVNQLNNSR